MSTLYISHPDCIYHEVPLGHPESSARLQVIEAELKQQGMWDRVQHLVAPEATRDQLERVHSAHHIDRIFKAAPKSGLTPLDPDTSMGPHSLSAALHAAGALVIAVDKVIAGEVNNAFCAVRPPGHHAEHDRVMGFCLFNNVAVAAAHALAVHGLERVAILDFDVHHGNGTQDIFLDEPRVLFCSTHQHPFYPFTGMPVENKNIINVPLPAGSGGAVFRDAIEQIWLPAIEAFAPQMLFVSAGFDAHRDDPLAQLALDDADFEWVTETIVTLADRYCQGRIVSTLEGGYDEAALARCVRSHIAILANTRTSSTG
ncbi:MAG: histone deacetylase family protein [Gammaproteobacteria bacterium]|nr:histone deacetylase family protein [Gammaproteobacteria bacterium]